MKLSQLTPFLQSSWLTTSTFNWWWRQQKWRLVFKLHMVYVTKVMMYQSISFVKEYFWCNFKFFSMFGNQDIGAVTLPKFLRIWLEPVFVKGQLSYNYFFQEPRFKGTFLVATYINSIAIYYIIYNEIIYLRLNNMFKQSFLDTFTFE